MQYTDNPIADALEHEKEVQDWLDRLPHCAFCHQPIQDENYFEIEGEPIHRECLTEYCEEHYEKENTEIEW